MWVSGVFVATGVLYAAACAFYLVSLTRGTEGTGQRATQLLLGAVVLHGLYVVGDVLDASGPPMQNIHQTLTVLSLGIVVAFLLAGLRKKGIRVLGAFVTPVALFFFLGSGHGRSMGPVPEHVGSVLLPVHIAVNVLGIVAFALAFAAALGYVLQEHQLKQKRLGGIFQRLPPLHVLDSFGFRSVTVGFPLLTLGIVTGAFWAFEVHPDRPAVSASQAFALVAWLLFAGVLLLRVAAGWRGRRAAIGTIMGFLFSMFVLIGYVLRDAGGSIG